MKFSRLILSTLLILGSGAVLAQGGQMDYEPFSTAVPIGGGVFLLLLGGLMAGAAFWRKRQGGGFNNNIAMLALSAGALASLQHGGYVIHEALANGVIELTNPNGGTVIVDPFYHEYKNMSGVPLKITRIIEPPCPAEPEEQRSSQIAELISQTAELSVYPACNEGLVLQDQEICFTDYCSNPI